MTYPEFHHLHYSELTWVIRPALWTTTGVHCSQLAVKDEPEPAVAAIRQLQGCSIAPQIEAVSAPNNTPVLPVVWLALDNLLGIINDTFLLFLDTEVLKLQEGRGLQMIYRIKKYVYRTKLNKIKQMKKERILYYMLLQNGHVFTFPMRISVNVKNDFTKFENRTKALSII